MTRASTVILVLLFTATSGCYGYLPGEWLTFGGHIQTEDGSPVEGVEVTFFWPDPPNVDSDGTWTVLTDENGWYSDDQWTLWEDKNFTITPSHPAYIFSPPSYSFSGAYEEHLDLDFTAIPAG